MKGKLISFDLQGTISGSAFSDEFWLELLPKLYAEKHGVTLKEAQDKLEADYQGAGKYHALFYDHRLRLDAILGTWIFKDIVAMLKNTATIDMEMIEVIQEIPSDIPIVILSATTRDFIDHELGEFKKHFVQSYSCIDDFAMPGKPVAAFEKVSQMMQVDPKYCLHIGDCAEMDFRNSQTAGWRSYHLDKKRPKETSLRELREAIQNLLLEGVAGKV